MNNAELIKALRCEVDCGDCAHWKDNRCDEWGMRCDAADALEADEAKIVKLNTKCADLQSQINSMENEIEELLPKEGEWIDENRRTRSSKFVCSTCKRTCYDIQPTRNKAWTKRCRYNYCPNCGAKMKPVTECHTLEEGEQHGET